MHKNLIIIQASTAIVSSVMTSTTTYAQTTNQSHSFALYQSESYADGADPESMSVFDKRWKQDGNLSGGQALFGQFSSVSLNIQPGIVKAAVLSQSSDPGEVTVSGIGIWAINFQLTELEDNPPAPDGSPNLVGFYSGTFGGRIQRFSDEPNEQYINYYTGVQSGRFDGFSFSDSRLNATVVNIIDADEVARSISLYDFNDESYRLDADYIFSTALSRPRFLCSDVDSEGSFIGCGAGFYSQRFDDTFQFEANRDYYIWGMFEFDGITNALADFSSTFLLTLLPFPKITR